MITGKYVLTYGDGTAEKDEQGRIILYTEGDAAREILDACMVRQDEIWEAAKAGEWEHEDDAPYILPPQPHAEGWKLAQSGTESEIRAFLDRLWNDHPDLDDGGLGYEPAEGFIDERKAIWTVNGGHIEGTKIEDMEVVDA